MVIKNRWFIFQCCEEGTALIASVTASRHSVLTIVRNCA